MTAPFAPFGRFRLRAPARTALLGLGVALALAMAADRAAGLGFAVGSLASAAALHLHGAQIDARRGSSPRAAGRRARLGSLLRNAVRGGALGLAYAMPGLSFGSAALGLFVGPAVLLAEHLAALRTAA
ncbi:MAG: hypothetical protein AB1578_22560 [Thermodesulfobacteriota bacterium]